MSKVHVIYNGTHDLDFSQVFPPERFANIGISEGVEVSSSTLTEAQVKTALAQHFDVGINEFRDHFVSFDPTGNITVRPDAEFGGNSMAEIDRYVDAIHSLPQNLLDAMEAIDKEEMAKQQEIEDKLKYGIQ